MHCYGVQDNHRQHWKLQKGSESPTSFLTRQTLADPPLPLDPSSVSIIITIILPILE